MNRPDDHLTEKGKALGGKSAADVIWKGVRREAMPTETLFSKVADILEALANEEERKGFKYRLVSLRSAAARLRARHDHTDPCEDEACPCYKAAIEHERDQGRGRL